MTTTNYLDLSYEGRTLAERRQLDNGKLPHGGYRGMRKHPMSHLSHGKGREFRDKIEEEISRVLEEEQVQLQGESPSWSLVVHREPSHSDQSPLIAQNFLSGSKMEQTNGVSLMNRTSLLPARSQRSAKGGGALYYRPNRLHQYLTATELKDSTSDHVDVRYGRPTRATLLRARSRCPSAPTNSSYENQRELLQRLDTLKHAWTGSSTVEYLQLDSAREEESLHSYLTGARYNRAHCLDSKSVEHSGVYMPRTNTAMACFFTGAKGQQYLQEFVETPRSIRPITPRSSSTRRRPLTAPSSRRRSSPAAPRSAGSEVKVGRRVHPRSAEVAKRKQAKLNVIGKCLPIDIVKVTGVGMTNGHRQEMLQTPKSATDDMYNMRQPPPTPNTGTTLEVFGEPLPVCGRGRGKTEGDGAGLLARESVGEKEKENEEDELARGQLVEKDVKSSATLVSVPSVVAETHTSEEKNTIQKGESHEAVKDILKEPLGDEDVGLEKYEAQGDKDPSPKDGGEREQEEKEKEEEEETVSETAEVVVKETLMKAERETIAGGDVGLEDSAWTDLSRTREDTPENGKQAEESWEVEANEQIEQVEKETEPDGSGTEQDENETEVAEEGDQDGDQDEEEAEVTEEQQPHVPETIIMNSEGTMEDLASGNGNNTEKIEEDHTEPGKTSDKEVRFFITENDEHVKDEGEATEYEKSEAASKNK